jgi:hypothetical protein
MSRLCGVLLVGFVSLLIGPPASFAVERIEVVGLRPQVLLGGGDPTNDVIGGGVYARLGISPQWRIGIGLDVSPEFDVERVARQLGIEQDPNLPVIDAKASSKTVLVWVDRTYRADGRSFAWFWTAGLGINSVDVDSASGLRADGGEFDVVIDAGTEPLLHGSTGVRWYFGQHWELELAFRLEQHFADWKLEDRASGRVATQDDYLLYGLHVGIGWRF